MVVPTLTEVDQSFKNLEIFYPELMSAGEAGNACYSTIEKVLFSSSIEAKNRWTIIMFIVMQRRDQLKILSVSERSPQLADKIQTEGYSVQFTYS